MAKINGQLENAQLENAAANPTPTSTGRMYMNITNPLAAVPYIWNGTAWRPLSLGQATATIVQSSAKAVTVNWANGLVQQVNLTDNCVISFSNPTEGANHVLIIQQSATIQYVWTYDMDGQDTPRPFAQQPSPLPIGGVRSYAWFYKAGIKAAVLFGALLPAATAIIPPEAVRGNCVSPDGNYYAAARASSPFNLQYGLANVDVATQSPFQNNSFGAPTLAGVANSCAYSPDGKNLYFASQTSPFIQGYITRPLNNIVDVMANPAVLPTGLAVCVHVHPTSGYVAVGHGTTPFLSVYPVSGQSYGTRLTNPGTLPPSQLNSIEFSPHGDYLTISTGTTPFIQTYAFNPSGVGTIGAVAANPSPLPTGGSPGATGKGVAWRPQGDFIAFAMTVTPYLYVVPFNRATGAYGTPLTIAAQPGTCNSVRWSVDGKYLFVGCDTTPFFMIYDFSNFTIGSAIGLLPVSIPLAVKDISVHPSGDYVVVAHASTPFHNVLGIPQKAKNYVRLS